MPIPSISRSSQNSGTLEAASSSRLSSRYSSRSRGEREVRIAGVGGALRRGPNVGCPRRRGLGLAEPAATAWVFAAGGLSLAAPVERPKRTVGFGLALPSGSDAWFSSSRR